MMGNVVMESATPMKTRNDDARGGARGGAQVRLGVARRQPRTSAVGARGGAQARCLGGVRARLTGESRGWRKADGRDARNRSAWVR
jgi:hypothetical protein